jgi:AcrR family transcriptional regulator
MGRSESPSVRRSNRALLQGRIVDAAVELAASLGWKSVRMADIADRAGVSRRTVFNEFGSKSAVLEAMGWRNTERLIEGAGARLAANPDDLGAAVAAAVEYLLRVSAEDPLRAMVLLGEQDGPDELLTLATTRSGPYAAAATEFIVGFLRERWPNVAVSGEELRFLVDSLVRLVISHGVQPAARPIEETARAFGDLAEKLLGS